MRWSLKSLPKWFQISLSLSVSPWTSHYISKCECVCELVHFINTPLPSELVQKTSGHGFLKRCVCLSAFSPFCGQGKVTEYSKSILGLFGQLFAPCEMIAACDKHKVLALAKFKFLQSSCKSFKSTKPNHSTLNPWVGWESFHAPGNSPPAHSPAPVWCHLSLGKLSHRWETAGNRSW